MVEVRKPEIINDFDLPFFWTPQDTDSKTERKYRKTRGAVLSVIVTDELHNGQWWRHITTFKAGKPLSPYELNEIKSVFIGENKRALLLLPRKGDPIKGNENHLHLFSNLGGNDFLPHVISQQK